MNTMKKSMMAITRNIHNQPKGTTTMKKMTKAFTAVALTAATFTSSLAYAASDYKIIQDGEVALGDGANALAKGRFSFKLPSDFDTTQKVVLQMRIRGATMPTSAGNVDFTKASVYLNPTNSALSGTGQDGCREDSATNPDLQANIDARITYIESHRTVDDAGEAFVQHLVLSGSKFNVDPNGSADNLLVICPRDSEGRVDTPGNSADDSIEVDDFNVSAIVLQYKTTK